VVLSRPLKILVGVLTVWPFVYMCAFVGVIVLSVFAVSAGGSALFPEKSDGPPIWFVALLVAHLATIVLALALTAFYIVYLFKTGRVEQDRKVLWAIVLFMGGPIGQLVFFCLYIWPERWPATDPAIARQHT